jgi:hypothetical protein
VRRRLFVIYINLEDAPQGPEIAINLVIDDSGSMAGDPIAQVRKALKEFLESTPQDTRIGLIGFGSDVHVYAEPTEHREFLLDQVECFQGHQGCTKLYDAVGEACDQFEDDGRCRYVLALTDGGDNASEIFSLEQSAGKKSLVEQALGNTVRVFAIGFGSADKVNLASLAVRTGGQFLEAADAKGLAARLADALRLIRLDQRKTCLRPEVTRLVDQSILNSPEWLHHFSVDEWDESSFLTDSTHLWFPKPERSDAEGYRRQFDDQLKNRLQVLLQEQVIDPLRRGITFPPHIDLILVGWLHDPAFRALSLRVLELFLDIQRRFPAQLPGNVSPILMPLVFGVGDFSPSLMSECYAWLAAAQNAGDYTRPKAVMTCGETNLHLQMNPHGTIAAEPSRVICQAANELRCLALFPDLASKMVGFPAKAPWRIRSVGAASLSSSLRTVEREAGLASLQQVVSEFFDRQPKPGEAARRSTRTFVDAQFSVESLKSDLLQPIDDRAAEGVLALVRLDLAFFWPRPEGVSEEDHFSLLSSLIRERGSEYLHRKMESLRRTLHKRLGQRLAAAKQTIASQVDECLFGRDDAGIREALDFLRELDDMLRQESSRIATETEGTMALERMRLFGPDEQAVRTDGELDVEAAFRQLERLIQTRPERWALAVRHGLLAVLLSSVVWRISASLTTDGTALSPLVPWLMSALAGSATLWSGAWRWRLSRQRIGTAVRECINALVRQARASAVQESLDTLRGFYAKLSEWIGDSDEIPEWQPDQERTEADLSQRQLVTGLGATLQDAASRLANRIADNPTATNPCVWEIGSDVPNPSGSPARISLKAAESDEPAELSWARTAPLESNSQWRASCRRKRCSGLQEYLSFHQERLGLPERLWRRVQEQVRELMVTRRSLSKLLDSRKFFSLGAVLKGLDSIAFPPLHLGNAPDLQRPNATWIANPTEYQRLLVGHQGDQLAAQGLVGPTVPMDATWEMHRVYEIDAGILQTVDWKPFRCAWEELDEASRRDHLRRYGDPSGWVDPTSGDLCLSVPEDEHAPAESTDQIEERL